MKKGQRENLRKLADHLYKKPWNYRDFDMGSYAATRGNELDIREAAERHPCGTVCCAAGHGLAAGIKAKAESWSEYVDRAFGADAFSELWYWLFAPGWRTTDNTARGAAKRIYYFLEHGIPDDASDQRHGHAPLCYLDQKPPKG